MAIAPRIQGAKTSVKKGGVSQPPSILSNNVSKPSGQGVKVGGPGPTTHAGPTAGPVLQKALNSAMPPTQPQQTFAGATAPYLKPSGMGVKAPVNQPRIAAPTTGTGYGGGAVGANAQGYISEAVAPQPPLSIEDYGAQGYAGQDAAYNAEIGSADYDLKQMLADLAQQNAEAHTNFKGNLKTLGYGFQGDDWQHGQWDPNDLLGAYGQTYQNLQNDYSGRGMLDSTFYGQSQQDMTNRFERQRNDLVSGLGQADTGYANSKTQAETAAKNARDRALAEAYTRYMAGMGAV